MHYDVVWLDSVSFWAEPLVAGAPVVGWRSCSRSASRALAKFSRCCDICKTFWDAYAEPSCGCPVDTCVRYVILSDSSRSTNSNDFKNWTPLLSICLTLGLSLESSASAAAALESADANSFSMFSSSWSLLDETFIVSEFTALDQKSNKNFRFSELWNNKKIRKCQSAVQMETQRSSNGTCRSEKSQHNL